MAIELISKIAPKNAGFQGMVDGNQIVGDLFTSGSLTTTSGAIIEGTVSGSSFFSGAIAVSTEGHTHAGGTDYWISGATIIHPISDNQTISGAGLVTEGTISGANMVLNAAMPKLHIIDTDAELSTTNANSQLFFRDLNKAILGSFGFLTVVSPDFWVVNNQTGGKIQIFCSGAEMSMNSAVITDMAEPTTASGAVTKNYADSGALWEKRNGESLLKTTTDINMSGASIIGIEQLSGAGIEISGAISGGLIRCDDVSGSNIVNKSFSGATLVSTNISGTSVSGAKIINTGDFESTSAAYVANTLYGTGETPPTATGFTRGSIYVQYTP